MFRRQITALLGIGLMALACGSPALADPGRDALQAARAKLDRQPSYRLDLSGQAGTTDIEYTAPSTVRITKPDSVGVMVDGVFYSNSGSDWATVASNTAILLLRRLLQQDALIALSDTDRVTDQGKEALNGVQTHRYRIQGEGGETRMVWVGADDGLPRQVEQGGDGAITATYSEFGNAFNITAPNGHAHAR